jgi:hypothetical protein
VTNSGTWTMGTSSNINGTTGGDAERFVNAGTLVKAGANTSSIAAAVRVDNTGTIDVQQATLNIGATDQISGTALTGGSWTVQGSLGLPSTVDTIDSAEVTLDGTSSSITALNGLATITAGSFAITNGRDFTTSGPLSVALAGTLRVGADGTLSVTGEFSTTGTTVFDLDGAPASGEFGTIVGTVAGTLGGSAELVVGAAYTRRSTTSSCSAPSATAPVPSPR